MKNVLPFLKTSCLLVFLFALPAILEAQEMGNSIEIFNGEAEVHQIKVKVLRIGNIENEEVLIQISGADDLINNHIFKYKKEWQSSEKRLNRYLYVTHQVVGQERYAPFHSENYLGSQIFKLFLINNPMTAIALYASPNKNLDPQMMYQQYLKQEQQRKQKKSNVIKSDSIGK